MQEKFNKIQCSFIVKILNKLGIVENFLHMTKGIHEKPTTIIILDGEKQNTFHIRSGIRQGCLLLPSLFIIELNVLGRPTKQEKKVCILKRKNLNYLYLQIFNTENLHECIEKNYWTNKRCQ